MVQVKSLVLAFCVGLLVAVYTPKVFDALHSTPAAQASKARGIDRFAKWKARQFVDPQGRMPVSCPAGADDTIVILVLGQSNAANTVGERFISWRGALNWLAGRCYIAAGPTLGSEQAYGSLWPLVGDMLIDRYPSRKVLLIGLAIGGTSIKDWADNNELGGFLERQLDEFRAAGLRITHVVWHQGEADGATPIASFKADLASVVRRVAAAYPSAKFMLAQASLCFRGGPSRPELLAAQASMAGGSVVLGPNTDLVNQYEDRYDECHFSGTGARKVAAAWAHHLIQQIEAP